MGIVDSNQLEDQESFEISLFRNGLTDNIRIGSQKIATVTIRDDDSKSNNNSEVILTPHTVNTNLSAVLFLSRASEYISALKKELSWVQLCCLLLLCLIATYVDQ